MIEALGPGWIDLRNQPKRIDEIGEAADLPALTPLLLALNAADSPLWTSKCDVWSPEPETLALAGLCRSASRGGESLCRLAAGGSVLPGGGGAAGGDELPECSV